ncbi:hypothetical protein HYX17_00755 [Candidatus Woesearchaeota archaeon]|nr:hypothetical protein [Candidatus Woesearchaeota archaeon]
MKKSMIVGTFIMDFFSILTVIAILIIFNLLIPKEVAYVNIKEIKHVITSEKVVSDSGITLKNLLNTRVDNLNLYEFILLNKNDEPKIKLKINELMSFICKFDKQLLIKDPDNICFWNLKIISKDKDLSIKSKSDQVIVSPIIDGGTGDIIVLDKEGNPEILGFTGNRDFKTRFSNSIILPDYENNIITIEFNLYKGI